MKIKLAFCALSFWVVFMPTPAVSREAGSPAQAVTVPLFARWTAYGAVREELIEQDWTPVVLATSDVCLAGDRRCSNRPEMHICSGFDDMPCMFLWKKENYFLVINTSGTEGETELDNVQITTDLKSIWLIKIDKPE